MQDIIWWIQDHVKWVALGVIVALLGAGSAFFFLTAPSGKESSETAAPSEPPRTYATTLIADDTPLCRETVSKAVDLSPFTSWVEAANLVNEYRSSCPSSNVGNFDLLRINLIAKAPRPAPAETAPSCQDLYLQLTHLDSTELDLVATAAEIDSFTDQCPALSERSLGVFLEKFDSSLM